MRIQAQYLRKGDYLSATKEFLRWPEDEGYHLVRRPPERFVDTDDSGDEATFNAGYNQAIRDIFGEEQ